MEWDEKECNGTTEGNACLSLRIFATKEVMGTAPGDVKGILHWAVYKGGDVDLFGPGDSPQLYSGETKETLLFRRKDDFSYYIHIPNVPPGEYQVLMYLDDNREANSGDPVTFPADAFKVIPDERTEHDVPLDYIR